MSNWITKACVGISIALLVACGGKEARLEEHYNKGVGYYTSGDYEKARVEFKNVLQIEPKHIASLGYMGQTLEALEDPRGAFAHYQRAVELNPGALDIKTRLARLYFIGRGPDMALDLANQVLTADAKNAGALAVRAVVKASKKEFDLALQDAEQAFAVDPNLLDAIYLLASLYESQQGRTKAIEFLVKTSAQHPKELMLQQILSTLYEKETRFKEAELVLTKLIVNAPTDLAHRINLAKFMARQKRVDAARTILTTAVAELTDHVEAKIVLAEFMIANQQKEEAVSLLKEYIKNQPKEPKLQFVLGALYSNQENYLEAEKVYLAIAGADKAGPEIGQAKNQLAKLYAKQKKFEASTVLLSEILKENPRDRDALLLRAGLAMGKSNAENAIGDYRAILKDEPNSIDVLKRIAIAYVVNQQPDLAVDSLKQVVALDPQDVPTQMELAKLYGQQGRSKDVLTHTAAILKTQPDNLQALEYAARAHLSNKEWEQALALAQRLEIKIADLGIGYYLAGAAYQGKGDVESAQKKYLASLAREPEAIEPLNLLIRNYLAEKRLDVALAELSKLTQKAKNHAVAYNIQGEIFLLKNEPINAIKSFKAAIKANDKFEVAYRNLANTYLQDKKIGEAEAAYKSSIKATQGGESSLFALATFYEGQGKAEMAIQQYEQILDKYPDSRSAANNLAMMLAFHKSDQASLDKASKLSEKLRNSTEPAYLDTMGYIHYKQGQYDQAIPLFKQALLAVPNSPLLRARLGQAQLKSGDKEGAKKNLEMAMTAPGEFQGRREVEALLAEWR